MIENSGYFLCLLLMIINGIEFSSATSINETSSPPPPLNETHTYTLKRVLLNNYDKYSRPSVNNVPTEVTTGLSIIHVSLDEAKGIFIVYGWIRMLWNDNKLKWNRDDYGNLSSLNFDGHEIWEPELIPLNTATTNILDNYGDTMMIAYPNGEVLRVPPFNYEVFCSLDFHLWPYDKQHCQLKLGTWNSQDVKLKVMGSYNDVDHFIENNEWFLTSFNHSVGSDPLYHLDYIKFDFVIERRSPIYKAVIITPASCIVLLILSSFWIPPQCSEKIILNGIVAILILCLLLYFAQMLPILAQNTPLVVLFFSSSFVLVTISMIISIIVMYIATSKHRNRLPNSIRNILNGIIGKILCLKISGSSSSGGINNCNKHHDEQQDQLQHHHGDKDIQENNDIVEDEHIIENLSSSSGLKLCSIQHDWILFATAIDRIFFIIYSIIFIVLATSYSV